MRSKTFYFVIIWVLLGITIDRLAHYDAGGWATYLQYRQDSGFWLPKDRTIVRTDDEYTSPIFPDGQYYMVFDTNPTEVQRYLDARPFDKAWSPGPFPLEICDFGYAIGQRPKDFESEKLWYTFKETKDFAHVELFVVEPEKNRIWYCRSDI